MEKVLRSQRFLPINRPVPSVGATQEDAVVTLFYVRSHTEYLSATRSARDILSILDETFDCDT